MMSVWFQFGSKFIICILCIFPFSLFTSAIAVIMFILSYITVIALRIYQYSNLDRNCQKNEDSTKTSMKSKHICKTQRINVRKSMSSDCQVWFAYCYDDVNFLLSQGF